MEETLKVGDSSRLTTLMQDVRSNSIWGGKAGV